MKFMWNTGLRMIYKKILRNRKLRKERRKNVTRKKAVSA